ncbi:MAG: UDP-N-acetylmuramoyl-L-alanyl-D-glutamate--2,6-diaminopimelate ligase [Alphaproteobacteria bacterium MarineAlpha3_Bin5]|nr:UDP-N-acetylmuramoyl-L-alanyl-D-glutamate--2,6-diaminopimelate ligase [Magnetovibrio sp.]PPR79937.1 MAG: UDP-N-acetylmuramoyl-L-alanyl-D-glutamate--2,6-diaminopimelate ligase [Alphaproteobacteria bacterium MarineAlpha3_Bin5]
MDIKGHKIKGLTCDSRCVKPGFLFAALTGNKADGVDFIEDAVQKGAVAILCRVYPKKRLNVSCDIIWLFDKNPRQRFALLAAEFYQRQPAKIAAVTGTNGKTSVVNFLRQIWSFAGNNAASIGTLGIQTSNLQSSKTLNTTSKLTTPGAVYLHQKLSALDDSNFSHVAIEASSHGLDQHRLDGVKISAAALTNFTNDHLDYHKTETSYLQSKGRLFSRILDKRGTAIINSDTTHSKQFIRMAKKSVSNIMTFGTRGADICLLESRPLADSQQLTLSVFNKEVNLVLPLVGKFQAFNAICALGLALSTGTPVEKALKAMQSLKGVRGRLELVAHHPSGASVYVDFAHTPDALNNLLTALRPFVLGKLHLVFGCGGERDNKKRSEMGRIANTLADSIIVTDDNPRNENPSSIRNQIISTCPKALEIGDRAIAIRKAVGQLVQGDILVVAGKGHEEEQVIGDAVYAFSDSKVIKASVKDTLDE